MDESFWSANNDDEDKECRYLGISENAPVDTCDAMGSNWPAWFDADYDGKCAMKPLQFLDDGHAINCQKGSPASLYGDNTIIGRSLAVHGDKEESSIDACCTIMDMVTEDGKPDRVAFRAETKKLMKQKRAIKKRRNRKEQRDVIWDSDDESDMSDSDSDDSDDSSDEEGSGRRMADLLAFGQN